MYTKKTHKLLSEDVTSWTARVSGFWTIVLKFIFRMVEGLDCVIRKAEYDLPT